MMTKRCDGEQMCESEEISDGDGSSVRVNRCDGEEKCDGEKMCYGEEM